MKVLRGSNPSRRGFVMRLSVLFLLFSLNSSGQGLTSLFCDFSGTQPINVDTAGYRGRGHYKADNAQSQIGIGVKFMEMSAKRDLHIGFLLAYRQINMSNFSLRDQSYQPVYQKVTLIECLLGGTYLPRKPMYQNAKLAVHFTLSGYAGFQGLSFGSNLSGGLVFLNKEGVAGLTFEFVYRPLDFNYANSGNDPYYVSLAPSWSIRAALTFGKNLKYNTGN
jgi:hypothetical protein